MNKRASINLYRAQSGFTLMEILIVLALIALIAGIVITNVGNIFGGGQKDAAKLWVDQIETPLMAYRINMGSYPTTEEGLQALVRAPAGKEKNWKGPYVKKLPNDPWDRPYQYRFPGVKSNAGYDVWSWGPKGVEGDDNIGNWE